MDPTDDELADLVAGDLERYLATVEPNGPVFAIALWADEGYAIRDRSAYYKVSIGTDADLAGHRSAPMYRNTPDAEWYGWPSSERWNSGGWGLLMRDFVTSETEAALDPLRDVIREEEINKERSCDLAWPCSCQGPGVGRWIEIAVAALRRTTVPATLPTTPDLLVYPEGPDLAVPQRATAMLRTVDPARFHTRFPVWRQLGEAVRAGRDADAMADLLAACDLASTQASDPLLRQALAVADTARGPMTVTLP